MGKGREEGRGDLYLLMNDFCYFIPASLVLNLTNGQKVYGGQKLSVKFSAAGLSCSG